MGKQKVGEKLATLIHISDLHFRGRFTNTNKIFEFFKSKIRPKGFLAHDYYAATTLSTRIKILLKNNKNSKNKKIPTGVIFSGDLTRLGSKTSFMLGSWFLRKEQSFGGSLKVGLNLGINRKAIGAGAPALFYVPGNHDILTRSKKNYNKFFPVSSFQSWSMNADGTTIYLYGLDSTHSSVTRNLVARGNVVNSQMVALENAIAANKKNAEKEEKNSIHIVFLHHPLVIPNPSNLDPIDLYPNKGTWLKTMVLDNSRAIATNLNNMGIDLVLSGHFHYNEFIDKVGFPNHSITGTATQMYCKNRCFSVIHIFKKQIYIGTWTYNDNNGTTFVEDKKNSKWFTI